ncbi:hypothetical protein [Austwickia sp. TVS 96-490-7B]|uniref:hypothetical protein n=1 Tax=Austwickia sp. TVS 96-490-7B TaxID=2830843 RepID=UPI001C55FCA8|nr:hypothetical protein [Austwickia sp. TVS 96-490-7B]
MAIALLVAATTGCASPEDKNNEEYQKIRKSVTEKEVHPDLVSEVIVHHRWGNCSTATILYKTGGDSCRVIVKNDKGAWETFVTEQKAVDRDAISSEAECMGVIH